MLPFLHSGGVDGIADKDALLVAASGSISNVYSNTWPPALGKARLVGKQLAI